MVAQLGRNYIIKANLTGSTYTAISGMQEPSVEMDNDKVDVTNSDSAGVQTLLEGAGVSSLTIKGKGIFVDDAGLAFMRTQASLNTHKSYQFVIPGTSPKTITGPFMITKFTESATYKEAGAYDFQLESAGPYTIA